MHTAIDEGAFPQDRTGRARGAATTAIVGGVALMVGAQLPWLTMMAGLQGYPGTTGPFGWMLLAAGATAASGSTAALLGWKPGALRAAGLLGLALLAFCVWLLLGLVETIGQLRENPILVASVGPGLFVCTGGAALLALTLLQRRTGPVHP